MGPLLMFASFVVFGVCLIHQLWTIHKRAERHERMLYYISRALKIEYQEENGRITGAQWESE